MRSTALLALLVACRTDSPQDITGPIGGTPERFVVDEITLPTTKDEATAFGDDLDGDGTIDNALGNAIVELASAHDVSVHGPDMLAGGRIATIAIVRRDGVAGAVYLVDPAGGHAVPALGAFTGGAFRANRARDTDDAGTATVVLPVFDAADPATLVVERLEIDLAPDGRGGFDATVRGVVDSDSALQAASAELIQQITNDPRNHPDLRVIFDTNHDGTLTLDEVRASPLLASLFAPDATTPDGTGALSIGFRLHLAPCPDGTCRQTVASCFDRVRDGDEADVDCGGSCALACASGATCTAAADCDAQACNNGRCAEPTCADGISDGGEGDIDCGGTCTTCAVGQRCFASRDCESLHCSACVPDNMYGETCTGAGTCEP